MNETVTVTISEEEKYPALCVRRGRPIESGFTYELPKDLLERLEEAQRKLDEVEEEIKKLVGIED
jgi:tetrahydromethanopterin S-methyltransferase subunit G